MSRLTLSARELGPFFGDEHAELAARLEATPLSELAGDHDTARVMKRLGDLGLCAYLVPESAGGAKVRKHFHPTYVDVRSLVTIREALGQTSPFADAIFAVQGLGSYPIVLAGTQNQKDRYLANVIAGATVAAFGLTEPEAGSDVASLQTTAVATPDGWTLDGEKTLISNVPDAKHAVVFANADPSKGRKGITAFVVDLPCDGIELVPIPMGIPHPIGRMIFRGARIPKHAILGEVGQGFRLAMETLDAFRISVGGAANGMATRALVCAIEHVRKRKQFGAALADQQIVKAYLADMATELDAARLLVARAAYARDTRTTRVSTEAAMAKMYATEAAQRIIDLAVQLHGGMGVALGTEVEALYREIRPLRIYEGTTEIQKVIIAKGLLDKAAEQA